MLPSLNDQKWQSKKLTIFEGPDGGGKTTTAKRFANETGALYVHFPSLPHVGKSLARLYVEAMVPALLGLSDVVMDRSWLSEEPYGLHMRDGKLRLERPAINMLERLAARCATNVIYCVPPFSTVCENYNSRRGAEYVTDVEILRRIYNAYCKQVTNLPAMSYDYTGKIFSKPQFGYDDIFSFARTTPHPMFLGSAGWMTSRVIIVGEKFVERKDTDPLYQWPSASFSKDGCSWWLTDQLYKNGISEWDLLWINADQDLDRLASLKVPGITVIALGETVSKKLRGLKISHQTVKHPQYWKRFKHDQRYQLIDIIKGVQGT